MPKNRKKYRAPALIKAKLALSKKGRIRRGVKASGSPYTVSYTVDYNKAETV